MRSFILAFALLGQCFAATTVEILAGDPRFSMLVGFVQQAGLVDALNQGTFTIFAPSNDAFNKVPSATLAALGGNITELTKVLTYHVVASSIMSSAAKNELQVTTLNGQKARFNVYDHNNAVTIQGCQIVAFDKVASNGVIHEVFNVMMPPTGDIVDVVSKTSNVSTLLSLVQIAGIAQALQADGLTVFAPTNEAFARLSNDQVKKITSNHDLLVDILQYHVVAHTEYAAGLYDRESIRTIDANRDTIQLHVEGGGVRVNTDGRVVQADIGTTNGVIHLIDHVLIPSRHRLELVGR
ncbi:BGH3-like protein [Mya arenaria]|uniref:BGH3-like protein n=1 Tax=Mya arenaria TaxID=6604 RepID=A0ABY7EQI2_MYAAR|nr:transforming growth factor-beta-induced protein ig-h3-like [Mya arenaria]WAR12247.1 BGH3-like protein [Mya arenaria]